MIEPKPETPASGFSGKTVAVEAAMDYAKESLRMHYEWKGKLEVTPRAAVDSAQALSLAYTPGVAQPCLEIQKRYRQKL